MKPILAEKRPDQEKPDALRTAIKRVSFRLFERGGQARSFVLDCVTAENLHRKIDEHVMEGSVVVIDDYRGYWNMPPVYDHKSIKHSEKKYVRREKDLNVHTNTVESKFSLLKRGITGTFHQVSKKHLSLYLAEFDHRFNHRKDTDGQRTISALKCAEGKTIDAKATETRLEKMSHKPTVGIGPTSPAPKAGVLASS